MGVVTSRIEVSGQRLTANYRAALDVVEREAGAGTALLAVIKANGYGHGAAVCARVLAGAAWLGVTDAAEGAAVRAALEGLAQPRILVMCGHLAEDAAAIVKAGLTPSVWTREQMAALAEAAGTEPVAVHVEVDSGMSRQGVAVADLAELLRWAVGESRIKVEGLMTHFASAEVAGSEQTAGQREQFEMALRVVAQSSVRRGIRLDWVHVGNTSAIDNGADGGTLGWLRRIADGAEARAMVREGLGLYGYCLPLEGLVASDGEESIQLRGAVLPVMTWKTRVIGVSEITAGARVGYSGTFVAERPMRLALLPVGYADGLRRELSSAGQRGGWVMIGGEVARIVGRVSMNLTTVDVTGIAGVAVGDEVVLLGEGCTAEDHAALAGTIPYEIVCGLKAPIVLV